MGAGLRKYRIKWSILEMPPNLSFYADFLLTLCVKFRTRWHHAQVTEWKAAAMISEGFELDRWLISDPISRILAPLTPYKLHL
jgi:hypothetical protein